MTATDPAAATLPLAPPLPRAPFLEGFGVIAAYPTATIERLFDYHAAVTIHEGSPAPGLGDASGPSSHPRPQQPPRSPPVG